MRSHKDSIGILLVHESPAFTKSIRATLQGILPSVHVIEANSFQQAMELTTHVGIDVIVTELQPRSEKCLEYIRRTCEKHEKLPVLVYGPESNAPLKIEALQNGAWGYMDVGTQETEVKHALEVILSGSRYISPETSRALSEYIRFQADRSMKNRLSNRELRVFEELKSGKSVSDLAHEMQLSEKTIRTYKRRLLMKLNVSSLEEVV